MYWYFGNRVDFMAIKDDVFTCIEIKVSKSDFKSKNGHNLIGHKNYYAMPRGLVDKVRHLIPNHVGVYALDNSTEYEDICFHDLNIVYNATYVKNPIIETARDYKGCSMVEEQKAMILTACNSTIRRIYEKDVELESKQIKMVIQEV